MSWALVGAAAISAVASGTQAGLASRSASDQRKALEDSGNFFFSDPLTLLDLGLSDAVGSDILASLGRTDPQLQRASDPLAQARAEINQNPGLSAKQKRRALAGLDYEVNTGNPFPDSKVHEPLTIALSQTSFGNVGALRNAIQAQQTEQSRINSVVSPEFLNTVLEGRVANERGIADLITNLQRATPDAVEGQTADIRELLFDLIDRNVQEQEEAILESANVSGINPAGAIGEVREAAQFQRQSADTDALSRALQLITGVQQAQQTELGTRLAAREGPQQNGLALLQLIGGSLQGETAANANTANNRTQLRLGAADANANATNAIGQGVGQIGSDVASLLFASQVLGGKKPGTSQPNFPKNRDGTFFDPRS